MPLKADIISTVYSPQVRSFDTLTQGTSTLKSTFEYIKGVFDFRFMWYADLNELLFFDNGAEIQRTDGRSFFDDGFSIGDFCQIQFGQGGGAPSSQLGNYTFNIVGISEDGTSLFTDTNNPLLDGLKIDVGNLGPDWLPLITGLTPLTAARFSFGLNENSETFNIRSKLTGEDQSYLIKDITAAPTLGEIAGTVKGWASNVGGAPTMQSLAGSKLPVLRGADFGSTTGEVPEGVQNFQIVHTFPILPFYTVGQLTNLQNNVAPEFLQGDNSLAYRFSVEMSTSISTEENQKLVELKSPQGSVGFFGENFNGIQSQYSFDSISYSIGGQPNDSLLASGVTDVEIIVKASNNTFTGLQNLVVNHAYLPANESEYLESENFFEEIFAYDAQSNGNTGPIVQNVATTLVNAGTLQINFQIDTSNVIQELTEENNYLLYVVLDDDSLSANNSDRTAVICDINLYDKDPDIPDLLIVDSFELFDHVTDVTGSGNTDYKGWIQDGYAVKSSFRLDRSKFAQLERIFVDLVAWNDSEDKYFTIQSNQFNLSNSIVDSDGNKQININELQGFKLDDLDQFNQKQLNTGAFDGTFISYDLLLGLKINWQDWLNLPDADVIFYDAAEPNNGLNQNSSRYNLKEGYQLKTILRADILETEQNVITEYIHRSDLNALNFDEFTGDQWVGTITTKRDDTGVDANGKILGAGKSTIITAKFGKVPPFVPVADDFEGIIRIVEQLPQGDKTIYELSSVRSSQPNNLLIPLDGEALTKVSVVGNDVILECRTDATLIQDTNYTVSARLIGEGTVIVGDFNDDFNNDFFV